MRVISAAEIDAVLTFERLVEVLRQAFATNLVAPPHHHHAIRRGTETATLLLMPAWTGGVEASYLATKLATVFPGNVERGYPSVYAITLLMDGSTGELLAAMDGTRLTLWRTAAASALAAGYLAREIASRLLMVGAGALAPFLIRAHAAIRPIGEVAVWNRDAARAQRLAAELTSSTQQVTVADDLEPSNAPSRHHFLRHHDPNTARQRRMAESWGSRRPRGLPIISTCAKLMMRRCAARASSSTRKRR